MKVVLMRGQLLESCPGRERWRIENREKLETRVEWQKERVESRKAEQRRVESRV